MSNPPHIAALQNDEHVKYIRRKNSDGFRLKYSLAHTERKQLVRETSVHALVLFEYYLRLASTENAVITDEDAAEYFDWSARAAQRYRLALTNAGWIAIEKAKLSNGRKIHVYYLGKDEVQAAGLGPKSEAKKPTNQMPKEKMFLLPE